MFEKVAPVLYGSYFCPDSCLVARIVSLDTAGVHLLTFRILELYLSKDIELDLSTLSHIDVVNIVPSN